MAMTTFTPAILDSYDRFQEFFARNLSVEKIHREAYSPPVREGVLGKWQVVDLTLDKRLVAIYTCFIAKIRELLFFLGLQAWGIQVEIHKRLWDEDMRLRTYEKFGEACLVSSVNAAAQTSWDVYLQPELPVESIGSRRVQEIVDPGIDRLIFFKDRKYCRGMSEWFLYLYFQTKRNFNDPDTHIQAVGRQFVNGASSEAVLLQVMCHKEREFLNLDVERMNVLSRDETREDDHRNIVEMFQGLEEGAYAVGTVKHRMNYICVAPGRGYFYNPNYGVIAIEGEESFSKLADAILSYTDDDTPDLVALEKIVSM